MKKILQELVVFLLNQKSLTKSLKINGDFSEVDYYCQSGFEMDFPTFQELVYDYIKIGHKSFEEVGARAALVTCQLDEEVTISYLEDKRLMIDLPYLGHLVVDKS